MVKILIAGGALVAALALAAFPLGISNTEFGDRHVLVTMVGLALLSAGILRQGAVAGEVSILPARHVLVIGCCLGLLAGFGEAAVLSIELVNPELVGRSMSFQQHWLWMQPIADLLLFAGVATGLVLLGYVWPGARSIRTVVWTFVFLGGASVLFSVAGLHQWAALVLATGIALITTKRVGAKPDAFYAKVRKSLPWAIALSGLLCVGVYLTRALPEWRAAPAQQRRDGPNVLVVVLDTVRAQSLGLYGYERPTTPRLVEFAASAALFDRALTTAPWTLPSHASMFTGRLPHELFPAGETPLTAVVPLDSPYPLLAEAMGSLGYQTVGIVANMPYCSRAHGLSRGFSHYEDYTVSLGWFLQSTSLSRLLSGELARALNVKLAAVRKSAADVNRAFLAWLEDRSDGPFFAFLNYFDAHDPFIVPEPFEVRYGDNRPLSPHWLADHASPEQLQQLRDGYDSCLLYLDHHIGLLLDELRRRGVLDSTLVIITADHGEQFGERGFVAHSNTVYRQLLQVPLLLSFPGHVPAGVRVAAPVSLRNLPTTIFDLADLQPSASFPGSSFAHLLQPDKTVIDTGSRPIASEVLVGAKKPPLWLPHYPGYEAGLLSLVADGYHYIRYRRDGELHEEIYDFDRDPLDQRDLMDTDDGREALGDLRRALDAVLADTATPK